MLKEIESISADLSIISELGLESLGYISANTAPTAQWIEESKLQISNALIPRGQTILMIVNAVELLFNHAQQK